MPLPETYGSYTLLELLGAGGMAEVFFARSSDPALVDRALVVKRMLPHLAENHDAVTLFLDEARLGAFLKHRHIVEILDVGELGGSWYMAMAFVDGPDFGKMLAHAAKKKDLPATLAAFVVARAAEGLHFAHVAVDPGTGGPVSVVHRDVSPQNILVDHAGVVRIADFGVARSRIQLHRTRPGDTKGKVPYMSPEQLDDKVLDARSDVRALGVVLWESLAMRRLYAGLTDVLTMLRITIEDPPPLAAVGVVIDDELEQIVARALNRDRDQRYASAAELAAALDDWSRRQSVPPSESLLASWIDAHFEPSAVVDGVPTQWAFRNMNPAGGALDDDATLIEVATAPPSPLPASASPSPLPASASPSPLPASASPSTRAEPPPRAPAEPHDTAASTAPGLPASSPPVSSSAPTAPAGPRFVPAGRPRPLTATTPGGRTPTTSTTNERPRDVVLYVEDEDDNRRVAELLLKKHFTLVLAPDDRTACEIVRERGDELAAVLMDIQLKGSALDGIALVRLLRGDAPETDLPGYARDLPRLSLPIFFVTAYAARYGEQELLAAGGDKLVTKPVDFTQLTMALTSFLLRRAAALPRSR